MSGRPGGGITRGAVSKLVKAALSVLEGQEVRSHRQELQRDVLRWACSLSEETQAVPVLAHVPPDTLRSLFGSLPDLDRAYLILRLQAEGYSAEQLCARLGLGLRRLYLLRAMAFLDPESQQLIRQGRVQESNLRPLLQATPAGLTLPTLLRCLIRHQPSTRIVRVWLAHLRDYPGCDPDTALRALLKRPVAREFVSGREATHVSVRGVAHPASGSTREFCVRAGSDPCVGPGRGTFCPGEKSLSLQL